MLFDLNDPSKEPVPTKYSQLDKIKPKDYSEKDLPEVIQTYKKLFFKSLTYKFGADLPLGAILSGGLDSSYITTLANQFQYNSRKTDLECFTIKQIKSRNVDLSFAKLLSQSQKHIKLHEVRINPHSEIEDFNNLTEILEQPVFDMTQKSMYENYRAVKTASLKSVLNGEGNDELWLGYYRREEFYRFQKNDYSEKNFSKYWYDNAPYEEYLTKKIKDRMKFIIQENIRKNFLPYDSEDKLNTMMWFSIRTHLQGIFIEEDLLSMANSVELRLPYIDLELFKFALTIPTKLKIWDKKEKYIVRMAAQETLPSEIIKRKKVGFPLPSKFYYDNFLGSVDVKKLKKTHIFSQLFDIDSFESMWEDLNHYQKYVLVAIQLFEKMYF